MYRDEIKYLKMATKEAYKRYTSKIQDEEVSLKNVTDLFDIAIDESRLEDYTITKIDFDGSSIFDGPSIELEDKKTNTTYISEYTYDDELSYRYGLDIGWKKSISLLSPSRTYKFESLYNIGEDKPIIERITFKYGDYDLVFEKFYPYKRKIIHDATTFTISYLQHLKHKEGDDRQILLTRAYEESDSHGRWPSSFEQSYTYKDYIHVLSPNGQYKHAYIKKDRVVYYIRENKSGDKNYKLKGFCFENTSGYLKDYCGCIVDDKYFQKLNAEGNTSVMKFKGYLGLDKGQKHFLDIYKNGDIITIMYDVRDSDVKMGALNTGNISNAEIQEIVEELQDQYSNDEFINLVSRELLSFGKKIDIRKGVVKEEMDKLNPKLFIEKPFSEIAELIGNNMEEYFELISNQFKNLTNIGQDGEKGKEKVIKL